MAATDPTATAAGWSPALSDSRRAVEQRHLAEEIHPGQERRRVGDGAHPGVPHQTVERAAAELDGPGHRLRTPWRRTQVGNDLGVAQVDADHLHPVLFGLPPGGGAQTRGAAADDDGPTRAHRSPLLSWLMVRSFMHARRDPGHPPWRRVTSGRSL